MGQWVNAGTPVLLGKARLKACPVVVTRTAYSCGFAVLVLLSGSRLLQNAVAEGDTRTISLHHIHTDEDITITFKRDGRYDEAALEKLNWILRDWRKQQETKMDPHLIDLIWEVQRETGSKEPVWVVCGYRSPETNAMLRRRSSGVARFSQHMLGHAMDFYIPGVQLDQLRAIGLRMQRGGVGFYPTSGSPFVHMDTGGIRMWPRMTHEQLVRVFPDGRTVHIPTDGRPLAGYELALADIRKRGNGSDAGVNVADAGSESRHFNPFSKLLHMARGSSDDEDVDGATAAPAPAATEPLRSRAKAAVVAAIDRVEDKLSAEKAKLAQVASKAEEKLGTEKTKLIKVASKAHVISRAEAATMAATPNQVILARGFWQGVPDGAAAAHPDQAATNALAAVARPGGASVASAAPDETGTIGPFSVPHDDRVSPDVALAYAEQARREAPAQVVTLPLPAATATPRAEVVRAVAVQTSDNETTVAVKRVSGRPASAILNLAAKTVTMTSPLADPARLDDPWLRAIVVSPSVNRFLCITMLGARDFRTLADMMIKPDNSVMMTFAANPNPGLDHDHFSGSAIVFMSTVTYYPLRSASLQ
jgi:uncharacterized protein YcbK (DUF882 family)